MRVLVLAAFLWAATGFNPRVARSADFPLNDQEFARVKELLNRNSVRYKRTDGPPRDVDATFYSVRPPPAYTAAFKKIYTSRSVRSFCLRDYVKGKTRSVEASSCIFGLKKQLFLLRSTRVQNITSEPPCLEVRPVTSWGYIYVNALNQDRIKINMGKKLQMMPCKPR
ncbi:ORF133 [Ranid herpesvirus 2]|uniref:ORF133 n=1 Tax=Ranid herpesvirus 2 TaxID=389214 RepID=Q14VX3_9VIRU|nr:ORF133 [Ranid herpesvirus 2]ABG25699.1 ORF133 [Ranid herpesvirus 2]